MDKFLTFPGVQPVYLNDIDFMQESVREAFRQLLQGLTGQDLPNCILVQPTASKDGVICFEGEIMPYKFYSGLVSGALCLRIETAYSGSRTFKDGSSHNCYETRYVVGYNGSNYGEEYYARAFPLFSDLIKKETPIEIQHGSDRKESDNAIVEMSWANIGDIYHLEGQVNLLSDANYTVIIEDMIVGVSGTMTARPIKYFPMIVNVSGVLQIIPAKMMIQYNTAGSCSVTITINRTYLTKETTAFFSLTLTA